MEYILQESTALLDLYLHSFKIARVSGSLVLNTRIALPVHSALTAKNSLVWRWLLLFFCCSPCSCFCYLPFPVGHYSWRSLSTCNIAISFFPLEVNSTNPKCHFLINFTKNPKLHQWLKLTHWVPIVNCRFILELHYIKESRNLTGWENCEVKTQEQNLTVKLTEMTEWICCFNGWIPKSNKSTYLNSILTYSRFSIGK